MRALTLLLYGGFVVYQSLADGGAWQCDGTLLAGAGRRLSRSDVLANVVAYVPLGLLVALAIPGASTAGWHARAGRAALGVSMIALMSLCLEVLQSCQAARVSSAIDWGANALGGFAGVVVGHAVLLYAAHVRPARGASASSHSRTGVPSMLPVMTAAVVGGWIGSQTMPWVFSVDVGTLRANLSFMMHWSDGPPLDGWRVLGHAGAWSALACACRLAVRDPRHAVGGFLGAGTVSLALQTLLDARTPLSFDELLGMAAVAPFALVLMLRAGRQPDVRQWAIGLALSACVTVAAYELRPGTSITAAIGGFSWWPRVGLGGLLGAIDYALLFGWFGLSVVIAATWADIARYTRARHVWPAVAVASMFGLEVAQLWIPGRGPDLSAPLFTLLAVLAATVLVRRDT